IDQTVRAQRAGREDGAASEELAEKLDNAVIDTLRESVGHGNSHAADLAKDERFAYLRGNNEFVKLVGGKNGDAKRAAAGPPAGSKAN
ncbi:MAG TPA: hypothetical protein VGM76_00600, partial [Lacipirellulaceae bacterium]